MGTAALRQQEQTAGNTLLKPELYPFKKSLYNKLKLLTIFFGYVHRTSGPILLPGAEFL